MTYQQTMPRYRAIATAMRSAANSERQSQHTTAAVKWAQVWERVLELLIADLPSGSGFDSGSQLIAGQSDDERLVFTTGFHHMNEHGLYTGWSFHRIIVKPSLQFGFRISSISGQDRNDIKEYITECFNEYLGASIDYTALTERARSECIPSTET